MITQKRLSTDHILDCDPGARSLLRPNRAEVVPLAKSKEPDVGASNGQVNHIADEQPVQEDEAACDVVSLDHGPDGDRPGNEEKNT